MQFKYCVLVNCLQSTLDCVFFVCKWLVFVGFRYVNRKVVFSFHLSLLNMQCTPALCVALISITPFSLAVAYYVTTGVLYPLHIPFKSPILTSASEITHTRSVVGLRSCSAVRCGAVRCGAVRCGAVRCGAVRCGAVRCGAVRCGAVRCGAVRCGAVRCGAVRCGAVRCGAVRCGAVRCGAVRCGAVRCGAVRCGAVRCGAVRCGAVQCSAVQCSAVQCSAVQCSAVQYSAVQYSTVQYSTVQWVISPFRCKCYMQCLGGERSIILGFPPAVSPSSTWGGY